MGASETRVCCTKISILSELPYANVDIIRAHGQFNNVLNSDLPTKKYLDKLHSIYDLDLFCLNTEPKLNPDRKLTKECFINDVSETDWDNLMANGSVDKCFSSFYNKFNKLLINTLLLRFYRSVRLNNSLSHG